MTLSVALVGIRHCQYEATLAPGMLKAAADARPGLRDRARIELHALTTRDDPEDAGRTLAASAGLLGVSCYLWNVAFARRLSAAYKAARPDGRVVFGGPEPSARPLEWLAGAPEVDWLAVGEAEETFAELLEALADGRDPEGLAGLAWREAGGCRLGPARPARVDLDALPSPYETGLLPLPGRPHVCFEASRGCPFDCKYCDWQNKQRVRRFSEARAERDMRLLLERLPGARVFVADSDLFLEPRRGARLARAWRRAAGDSPCAFEVHTYLPRLDDDALRALDAPQFTVCVGLQSSNPKALAAVSRFFDGESISERAAAFRRLAPRARLNLQLIYGLPGDDPEGFAGSLEYALSLEPDTLMLFPALALPGSEMGRDPSAFGLSVSPEPPYRVLETPGFTAAALAEADQLAFQLFTFQRHGPCYRVLRRLGAALAGRGPGARLGAFTGFARFLAGTPFELGPIHERARRDLLGFLTFEEEPWGGMPAGARDAALLRLLADYVRRRLEEAAASELWPSFAADLEAERRDVLWRELTASAGFHRLVGTLAGAGAADGLWIGSERAAAAEAPFWPEARRWHWLPPGPEPDEPCRGARHFGAQDLDAAEFRARGHGGVVLSQVCRSLAEGQRRELFADLRRGARHGSRLTLFDSGGAVRFEPARLAAELRAAGWRMPRAPRALGAWFVLTAVSDEGDRGGGAGAPARLS
ncbi:MAG: cobalamin B12-binding domain-containing protein [Elusimicrobia bacterium]|nr:cobalamin B12-binding domain-containing protein [Elusimicrobiota bacterium]